MDRFQRWFMIAAAVFLLCVVALELGSALFFSPAAASRSVIVQAMIDEGIGEDEREEALAQLDDVDNADDPPGLAIPALAALDGLLFLSIAGLALSLFVPHRIMGRITAPANLVVSFFVILGGIVVFFVTLVLLFLMTGLFLAPPFGTITYLVRWGFFPRGDAQLLLGVLLFLKLGFVVSALVASPRLLKNKGLVAMTVTSLVLQLVIGFLHALVPLPIVSITDAVAALVVLIVAVIWAIVIFVGSLVGSVRVLRVTRG